MSNEHLTPEQRVLAENYERDRVRRQRAEAGRKRDIQRGIIRPDNDYGRAEGTDFDPHTGD